MKLARLSFRRRKPAARRKAVVRVQKPKKTLTPWRRLAVMLVFMALVSVLLGRALDMQVLRSDFYQAQGEARQLRTVTIPAHRGDIVDRNGQPLAISAPVKNIWINPKRFFRQIRSPQGKTAGDREQEDTLASTADSLAWLTPVAGLLGLDSKRLRQRVQRNAGREFLYLKRQVSPELAEQVLALSVPGVAAEAAYHRYYPGGEITAHVLGFVDIDDRGQEGLERAFDAELKGRPGRKRVIRDRLGRIIDDIERITPVQPGRRLQLSLDRRLQYLAYRSLKSCVLKHNAVAGSVVVLDARSGEVLAMASQPSFNVNDRRQLTPQATRNRAVVDVFEPGSTMKPISIAAALESGRWKPYYKVKTAPGWLRLGAGLVRDERNHGDLDVGGVIEKSSNVGVSKIVLGINAEQQWGMYNRVGFGQSTGSGFPGEAAGHLSRSAMDSDFARATMAYGYGISVTPLQLARAYAAIANDGILPEIQFLRTQTPLPGRRVMSAQTARELRKMMQRVLGDGGTGKRARVANYSVAGKTGTVHKFIAGGYAPDRYLSIFAGMIPAEAPRLVMVAVIDEPRKGGHYGGQVAAPLFSEVMTGAVRLLDIAPDRLRSRQLLVVRARHTTAAVRPEGA